MNLVAINGKSGESDGRMMKFLYSYGGKIITRSADAKLIYVGGHTRILAVNRSISFDELIVKFTKLCGYSVRFKCKLPEDNLDLLVSIKCDEDLANIVEEYDRFSVHTQKDTKIRAILLPIDIQSSISIGKLDDNQKSANNSLPTRKLNVSSSPPMNIGFRLINRYCTVISPASTRYGGVDVKKLDGYRPSFRRFGRQNVIGHQCDRFPANFQGTAVRFSGSSSNQIHRPSAAAAAMAAAENIGDLKTNIK